MALLVYTADCRYSTRPYVAFHEIHLHERPAFNDLHCKAGHSYLHKDVASTQQQRTLILYMPEDSILYCFFYDQSFVPGAKLNG